MSTRLFLRIAAFSLACSVLCAVVWSWRWPLVGDATLMHYVVFLMGKGMRPYADIVEINLPGSYFFEAGAMHLLGWGARAWRIYDLAVLALIGGAVMLIAGRTHRYAGWIAAGVFAMIHIQDGFAQLGQRDLLLACLLLWAYVALFASQRAPHRPWWIFLFAFLMGVTLTIKPTFLLLGLFLFALSFIPATRSGTGLPRHLGIGIAGFTAPVAAAVVWLCRHHSLSDFIRLATTLIPFHAGLAHRSFGYLLVHSCSPIGPVVVVWLLVALLRGSKPDLERLELLAGVACALASYLIQGKGLAYHRYPFLAILLPVMEIDFVEALAGATFRRIGAVVALSYECFVFAPRAALLSRSFEPATPFANALGRELTAFGPGLSGHVQCIDTFSGCVATLYDLRLVQSTGFLYDCYLFAPGQNPTTTRYREDFWRAYESARPEVLVISDQLCFEGSRNFNKLETWPLFREELADHFTLKTTWTSSTREHWWSRPEYPHQFRIYIRRDAK